MSVLTRQTATTKWRIWLY